MISRTALINALLLVTLLAAIRTSPAVANGATVEVLRTVEGPYEIVVGTLPFPPTEGLVHLTVTITELATAQPVTDAHVEVFARRQGKEKRVRAELFNSQASPLFYDRNVELSGAGLWLLSIEVSSQLGDAVVDLTLEVQGMPRSLGGMLAWVGMTVIILLGGTYVWWSISRSSRKKRLGN